MQHRKCFKLFVKLTKESEKITKQSEILWKKNWLSSQNMMWDTKKAKLLIFIFTTTDVSAIDKEIRKPSYLILLIINSFDYYYLYKGCFDQRDYNSDYVSKISYSRPQMAVIKNKGYDVII